MGKGSLIAPRSRSKCVEFDGNSQLSCFELEIPFSRKFGPKHQNIMFKLKFGVSANSDMLNLMVMVNFSHLD